MMVLATQASDVASDGGPKWPSWLRGASWERLWGWARVIAWGRVSTLLHDPWSEASEPEAGVCVDGIWR